MADDSTAIGIFMASMLAGEINLRQGLTAEQKLDLEDILSDIGINDASADTLSVKIDDLAK
ncbi:hypothetical protein, partial [Acinetobacter baumannii]|uniref:hypothetical protein n=1 Tax=Acinetobacter baumannii TaxID=470 RepID=UPI0013D2457B